MFDVSVILHPEVESKIKLNVVRSLGDKENKVEDASDLDRTPVEIDAERNKALLDEGVTLKKEEGNSEEIEIENKPDNKSTE